MEETIIERVTRLRLDREKSPEERETPDLGAKDISKAPEKRRILKDEKLGGKQI